MADLWSDVAEQPILVSKSGTCANVIADSTPRIQQCIQQLLDLLDTRARAWAACGNFEPAWIDAARIRQLAPFSVSAYLCGGHVYSLQGRQKAAIAIYDQGLKYASLSDPSHQQLVEARSMAHERDSTKIDFIKEFPIDIIENIAPRILSQEEMIGAEIRQYLEVSHVWRERLLMCIRELHLKSETYIDDLTNHGDLLEYVASHCTTLTLQPRTAGFPRLVSMAQFPSLRTLVSEYPATDDDHDFNTTEKALGALEVLGTTLTHLAIYTHLDLSLGSILSSCPNVVYLETSNLHGMDTVPECYPTLKALLFCQDDVEPSIHDVTKRFPGLEVFMVSPFMFTTDLNIVQDNCPNLKILGCNVSSTQYDRNFLHLGATGSSADHTAASDGIHTLYLNHIVTVGLLGSTKDILDFMTRNSHSLQRIHICAPLPDDPEAEARQVIDTYQQMTNADNGVPQFQRLTRYLQDIYGPDENLMAEWVVKRSPYLKELELVDTRSAYFSHYLLDGGFFDNLIGLHDLEMINCFLRVDSAIEVGGLERFIQYHKTIDSQLHTLVIPEHARLSNDALDALTTLERLEVLGFSLPLVRDQDTVDNDVQFSRFIEKLISGCPRLHRLRLHRNYLGPSLNNDILELLYEHGIKVDYI